MSAYLRIGRALNFGVYYRREDGEWKIVHRHGDNPPPDASPRDELAAERDD